MVEFEVHSSSANVDRAYLRLRKEKGVCERNKELLLKFSQDRLARGVSRLRTVKCLYVLRYMARWHKASFEEATKESLTLRWLLLKLLLPAKTEPNRSPFTQKFHGGFKRSANRLTSCRRCNPWPKKKRHYEGACGSKPAPGAR